MNIVEGQIWQEVDNRFDRYIKVLKVGDTRASIITCDFQGEYIEGKCKTTASLKRFNEKYHGYKLVKDIEND